MLCRRASTGRGSHGRGDTDPRFNFAFPDQVFTSRPKPRNTCRSTLLRCISPDEGRPFGLRERWTPGPRHARSASSLLRPREREGEPPRMRSQPVDGIEAFRCFARALPSGEKSDAGYGGKDCSPAALHRRLGNVGCRHLRGAQRSREHHVRLEDHRVKRLCGALGACRPTWCSALIQE